ETLGVYSQTWHYQKGQRTVSLALDYPFVGYHDVTICYTDKGWTVSELHSATAKSSTAPAPHVQARMHDDLGLQGALWFSPVDERGRWLPMPGRERNLLDRWKIAGKPLPTTYRIQVLATAYSPLPAAEEQQIGDFFEQARLLLWRQLSSQIAPAP